MAKHQTGFSTLSLLIGVVLLVAGLSFFLVNMGLNASGQLAGVKAKQLVAQSQLIAHRIAKCATDYPDGNNGSGFHPAYPGGQGVAVSSLTCPKTTLNLWSGSEGVFLPAAPDGYGNWTYTNNAAKITIAITATDPLSFATQISTAANQLGSPAAASADTLTVTILQ